MLSKKSKYFLRSATNYFTSKSCPYCNSKNLKIDDKKYVVTRLFECQECSLKYRHPKDDIAFNKKFYTKAYKESDGITTELPNKETLQKYIETNFADTNKSAIRDIELIRNLIPKKKIKVLDFGANWGYTSYQFQQAGFEVVAYEISAPRAAFGKEKLGINILTDIEDISGEFDIFFSSHVIEHLPDINIMFNLAKKVTRKGGYLITFCPNGSEVFKKADFAAYHACWGLIHPNYITDQFFEKTFSNYSYFIGSGNKNLALVNGWNKKKQVTSDMSNWEFFSIVKM